MSMCVLKLTQKLSWKQFDIRFFVCLISNKHILAQNQFLIKELNNSIIASIFCQKNFTKSHQKYCILLGLSRRMRDNCISAHHWQNSAGITTRRVTKHVSFEAKYYSRDVILHMNVSCVIFSSLFSYPLELMTQTWRWQEQWILYFQSVRWGINLLMALHSNPAFRVKSKIICFIVSVTLSKRVNPRSHCGETLHTKDLMLPEHVWEESYSDPQPAGSSVEQNKTIHIWKFSSKAFYWLWSRKTSSKSYFFFFFF